MSQGICAACFWTEDEWRKAEERARPEKEAWEQELRQIAREAALERYYAEINTLVGKHLHDALERVRGEAVGRVTEAQKDDFRLFATHCEQNGFPYLPTRYEAVLDFLIVQDGKDIARLCDSISVIHHATNFDDPTAHEYVRAYLISE
jgi:hypothetical protein